MIMDCNTFTKDSMLGYKPESTKAKSTPMKTEQIKDNDQTRDAVASMTSDSGEARVTDNSSVGPHDILLGRGGATNSHTGNRYFRTLVAQHQQEYLKARKREKVGISRRIVAIVKGNGGRFLKRTDNAQNWIEVADKRAQEKTSQALREGLDVRNNTTRPNKMIKEIRPPPSSSSSTSPSQRQEEVAVPGGQIVQIKIPQFSPNSTVSHLLQNAVVPSGGVGSALFLPQLTHFGSKTPPQLMNPVLLHYNLPVVTQKDVKHHEV